MAQSFGPQEKKVFISLYRGEWETAEDRFIASFVLKKGKKWSEMAKNLQN